MHVQKHCGRAMASPLWLERSLGPAGKGGRSRPHWAYRTGRTTAPIWPQWNSIEDFKQREWQSLIAVWERPPCGKRACEWKADRTCGLDIIATKHSRSNVGLVSSDEGRNWLHLTCVLVLSQAPLRPCSSYHQKCAIQLACLLSSYSSFRTLWFLVLFNASLESPHRRFRLVP